MKYLKGFLKGSGLTILLLTMVLTLDYLVGESNLSGILAWLISLFLVIRSVYKEKFSKVWILPTVVLGIVILPFFYGYREIKC